MTKNPEDCQSENPELQFLDAKSALQELKDSFHYSNDENEVLCSEEQLQTAREYVHALSLSMQAYSSMMDDEKSDLASLFCSLFNQGSLDGKHFEVLKTGMVSASVLGTEKPEINMNIRKLQRLVAKQYETLLVDYIEGFDVSEAYEVDIDLDEDEPPVSGENQTGEGEYDSDDVDDQDSYFENYSPSDWIQGLQDEDCEDEEDDEESNIISREYQEAADHLMGGGTGASDSDSEVHETLLGLSPDWTVKTTTSMKTSDGLKGTLASQEDPLPDFERRVSEYLTFEETLGALSLDEDGLKRLIFNGELRAHRDGRSMKFETDDVLNLKKGLAEDSHQQGSMTPYVENNFEGDVEVDLSGFSFDQDDLSAEGMLAGESPQDLSNEKGVYLTPEEIEKFNALTPMRKKAFLLIKGVKFSFKKQNGEMMDGAASSEIKLLTNLNGSVNFFEATVKTDSGRLKTFTYDALEEEWTEKLDSEVEQLAEELNEVQNETDPIKMSDILPPPPLSS